MDIYVKADRDVSENQLLPICFLRIIVEDALSRIKENTGRKFIVIIDEWDVLIRDEAMNKKVQHDYINFLRGLFKGTEPTKYIQLAYMTGILPVKREKTQSALNNFDEYTKLSAGKLAPYVGFTEAEVKGLCEEYHMNYDKVRYWYDGYMLGNQHVYNPKAVVSVIQRCEFRSYWSQTSTFESIIPFINMNFDGLKNAIIEMIAGSFVKVNPLMFQNDMVNLKSKDDVLTLLIHLGYLAYDPLQKEAFIPNEEIRQELLVAALDMDEETVADMIGKIHTEYIPAISYNDENSLSCVISIAYLSTMEQYYKPVREMPTGRGFADFVFIPKPEYKNSYPALVVELKWNKNAETAIRQIKEKKYPESLAQYTEDILLVGINYDKKIKSMSV